MLLDSVKVSQKLRRIMPIVMEQKKNINWEEQSHLEREIKLDDNTIKYLNSLK